MTQKYSLVFTVLIIWLSLYLSPLAEIYLAGFFSLTLGLMHGSFDIFLFKSLIANAQNKQMAVLIAYYLLFVFMIFFLVYWAPVFGFWFFLLVSSYHFGEQHLHTKPLKYVPRVHYLIYGFFLFGMLVSSHLDEVAALLLPMTGYSFIELPWEVMTLTAGILLSLLWIVEYRAFQGKTLQELFYLLLFWAVFNSTDLALSFGLYFVLWHALPSVADQINQTFGSFSSKHLKLYLVKGLPFWGAALVGFTVLLWANAELQGSLFPVLLAAGVGITFPHILLIERLFKRSTN